MSLSHPSTPEAPPSTCPSPWGGTPPNRSERPERTWTPGRSAPTSGPSPPSTRAASPTEIVPIKVTTRDGSAVVFDTDEHPRRDSTAEKLASLKPLHPEIQGFSITAGNASGVNDAASALVVTSDAFAAEHGLTPLATVRSWASVGVDPKDTGMAPTIAIPKALERAGMTLGDVDLCEINEAFASVPVACCPGPRPRRGPDQHLGQWLQPGPSHRRHRGPDAHHPRL